MQKSDAKIFGIGLSKTGTTSLTKALKILGYKTVHFPFFHLKRDKNNIQFNYKKLNKWDAVTDTPIPYLYKDVDKQFPGAKFILTVRDKQKWLRSCRDHHIWPGHYIKDKLLSEFVYIKQILTLHHHLYGSVEFNEKTFSDYYDRHYQDVINYFRGREEDLLILDISAKDSWEKLCSFLGKSLDHEGFPVENVGKKKYLKRVSRKYFWGFLSKMHLGHSLSNKDRFLPQNVDLKDTA